LIGFENYNIYFLIIINTNISLKIYILNKNFMIYVIYKPQDLRYVFFHGDDQELIKLENYLNKIPQYQFLPSFRGIPKPEVFLNKFKSNDGRIIYWCHAGLWKTVVDWCTQNHINIEKNKFDDNFKYTNFNVSLDAFKEYVQGWGLNISPYDYQIKAAWMILKYRQSLSQLATRAGKTLIAYMVFRYMLEHGANKILMIVPSIQLVKQGVQDMKEYQEFFQSETVWAKSELCESSNLTIGTYQSLVQKADKKSKKYDPKFFDKFDVVCVDEAHHLICKSINTILNQDFLKFVKIKFGFTGTLPKEGTIESFCCHSLMGPTIQDLAPMELVDGGFLAKPHITQIRINYKQDDELTELYIKCGEYLNSSFKMDGNKKILLPKSQRDFTIQYEKSLPYAVAQLKKVYEPEEYASYLIDLCKANGSNLLMLEQMMLHRSTRRLEIMKEIINTNNKNCIVFAHHTEYLKYLAEYFKKEFPNKQVLIIEGSKSLKKRQEVINKMLDNNNVILCASYGCCSTGITFKNVDYGIFAQSFKSEIVNLQSIGRLMLKNNEKDTFNLYDIVDCYPTKRIYTQGLAKIRTYNDKGFDYIIINK
jgi:superfamily II DNA or RNA helicase